jgi:hypothetical protein
MHECKNGNKFQVTKLNCAAITDLSCDNLKRRDRLAHLINGPAQHSLLPCGQMCDAGYKVLFEEGGAKVINGDIKINSNIVMQRQRDRETGLWAVPLDNSRANVMTQHI